MRKSHKRRLDPSPTQQLLGLFVEGMPKRRADIPKTVVDLLAEPRSAPGYQSRSGELADGEYDFNDMLSRAKDILFSVHGERVLVCPECKSNVELVEPKIVESCARPGDTVIWKSERKLRSSFVRCGRCNLLFFMPELVQKRSFRLVFPGEDTASYHLFLQCIWHDGVYRVVHGDFSTDVTGAPSGDTWESDDEY